MEIKELSSVAHDSLIGDAIKLMKSGGFSQLGVKNDEGEVIGILTTENLIS